MKSLLDITAARVFFDGIFSDPRVAHPEGVAVHADGSIWCGNEVGELLRIDAGGTAVERMGTTGGFLLGIAFDSAGNCYACDLRHSAIFRYEAATGRMERFADAGIKVPNYPVVDAARGCLYVSDSAGDPGIGIYRYDLGSGEGGVWHEGPTRFANGMALAPDGQSLYVCETFAQKVSRIPILADGSAGAAEPFATDLPGLPDGLAFDDSGYLFVGCYEPSRVLRIAPDGKTTEVYIEEPTAHLFAHPTNLAFDGPALTAVAGLVRSLVVDGVPSGAHDASGGGLGVALGELVARSGVGVDVAGVPSAAHLLAEAPGRVVLAVTAERVAEVLDRAAAAGVAAIELGSAGGDRFRIDGLVDRAVDEVVAAYRDRLPTALGAGTVQG